MKNRYPDARKYYTRIGIDTDSAIERLKNIPISIHCWQGDDVGGFEGQSELSGGIAATGNYPGKARNADELMADLDLALCLIPGKKRINLHASYAITDEQVDRDKLQPHHFAKWVDFAKECGLGLDFNPTFFSHPKAADSLTLSHPDEKIRTFWIDHAKACRKIAAYFGEQLGTPSLCNIWIPDGYKNVPADKFGPRKRLKESLDEIYSVEYSPEFIVDSLESKVFGLGLEAFTVGSNEFYISYAATHKNIYPLLDNGHYHPTEVVSDKIPALLNFFDKIPLHVTRPIRWDSDHVVLLDDELKDIATEIIRNNADERVLIGLDYFDASINRIAAWVVGARNMQKALLGAMLVPHERLAQLQNEGKFTEIMVANEEAKTMPFGDIWEEYCKQCGVIETADWYNKVAAYEKEVLLARNEQVSDSES